MVQTKGKCSSSTVYQEISRRLKLRNKKALSKKYIFHNLLVQGAILHLRSDNQRNHIDEVRVYVIS